MIVDTTILIKLAIIKEDIQLSTIMHRAIKMTAKNTIIIIFLL